MADNTGQRPYRRLTFTSLVEELERVDARAVAAEEKLEAVRVLHAAPCVDEGHRGGNCVDVLLWEKANTRRAEAQLADANAVVAKLTDSLKLVNAVCDRRQARLDRIGAALRDWPEHDEIRNILAEPFVASEEPAGETKPRVFMLHGVPIPDCVHQESDGALYCNVDGSAWGAPENTPQFGQWVAEHTHGQPVERQADSEAQR